MGNKCVDALDDAISILEEMKAMLLTENDPDIPLAFFEAYQDAQHHLNTAVSAAISPLLTMKGIQNEQLRDSSTPY